MTIVLMLFTWSELKQLCKVLDFLTKRKSVCVAEAWPFSGVSWCRARCGACNTSVQTASLQCFSITPCLKVGRPAGRMTASHECRAFNQISERKCSRATWDHFAHCAKVSSQSRFFPLRSGVHNVSNACTNMAQRALSPQQLFNLGLLLKQQASDFNTIQNR